MSSRRERDILTNRSGHTTDPQDCRTPMMSSDKKTLKNILTIGNQPPIELWLKITNIALETNNQSEPGSALYIEQSKKWANAICSCNCLFLIGSLHRTPDLLFNAGAHMVWKHHATYHVWPSNQPYKPARCMNKYNFTEKIWVGYWHICFPSQHISMANLYSTHMLNVFGYLPKVLKIFFLVKQ